MKTYLNTGLLTYLHSPALIVVFGQTGRVLILLVELAKVLILLFKLAKVLVLFVTLVEYYYLI